MLLDGFLRIRYWQPGGWLDFSNHHSHKLQVQGLKRSIDIMIKWYQDHCVKWYSKVRNAIASSKTGHYFYFLPIQSSLASFTYPSSRSWAGVMLRGERTKQTSGWNGYIYLDVSLLNSFNLSTSNPHLPNIQTTSTTYHINHQPISKWAEHTSQLVSYPPPHRMTWTLLMFFLEHGGLKEDGTPDKRVGTGEFAYGQVDPVVRTTVIAYSAICYMFQLANQFSLITGSWNQGWIYQRRKHWEQW